VVVAALAAGVGAGTVLAINNGKSSAPAASPPLHQHGLQNGSGIGSGLGGTGLSNSTEQAIVNKVNPGLVDITSHLRYTGGTAEATGMVISSAGLVLTNNHVIDGSTELTATLVGTGRRYAATVVGYDKADDIAVIRLTNASGLRTIPLGDSSKVQVGNTVVALGNRDGQGGAPAVAGSITGINQTITASDEGSASGKETLHGMLQTNAQIVPGDSGGPLANLRGEVIGMNTAAATGTFGGGQNVGFAIPANKAIAIARQIASGKPGPNIKLGLTGFLGVLVPGQNAAAATNPQRQRALQLHQQSGFGNGTGDAQGCLPTDQNMGIPAKIAPVKAGALVDGVLCNTPSATSGMASGDVIISVDGQAVTSPKSLTATMEQFHPRQQITVVWVDPSGRKHTAGVTLTAHPPE
jgi:S1-C subfamily serine protease